LIIYFTLAPVIPAILIHIAYVLIHIILIPLINKGHIKIAKYVIITSFIIQLTLATFHWFPLATNYGLFYYLLPIASFALMDISVKSERYYAVFISLLGIFFYYVSLSLKLNYSTYELSELAIRVISSFSIISTIGPATLIFYLYAHNMSKVHSELTYLAKVDALTNVFNRRMLFEIGDKEFNLAKKYGYEFTVLILDIDHFKQFNDNYGHHIGDLVLIAVTSRISKQIRDVDMLFRQGGEEFALILKNTTKETGMQIAEKLKDLVNESDFMIEGEAFTIEISVGGVQFKNKYESFSDLLKQADQALYMAKDQGRKQVVFQEHK
jgi:diguanylate cyclase (GGDEF)-like protein